LRACTASTILRASSGNSPSSANEARRPGETMPARESMRASCVPALT